MTAALPPVDNHQPPSPATTVDALLALGVAACPLCHATLRTVEVTAVACTACATRFAVRGSVLDLRPPQRESVQDDEGFWEDHWSDDRQETLVQRFFSWYRKAVFARTVAYFVQRYFPARAVLVEAGSGTAETSMRIDTAQDGRQLVALDLIPAVLTRVHPIMHHRLAGDIFRLPLADDSVDGIWNVGVMEHFTHPQIDAILAEFRRVLRPGGRIILLWPGSDSIPQKMLEAVAFVVNTLKGTRAQQEQFRFHPPEISRLRSRRHGREVMSRNGFDTVTVDPGIYSLMAFKTVVAEKPRAGSATSRSLP
ncbi:MAG: methyltransferase domain-containing protein [Gemmatimonadetes bacterium]|nr:methyltransferase domain-containing protein [Gemmatimonadota bacterium]